MRTWIFLLALLIGALWMRGFWWTGQGAAQLEPGAPSMQADVAFESAEPSAAAQDLAQVTQAAGKRFGERAAVELDAGAEEAEPVLVTGLLLDRAGRPAFGLVMLFAESTNGESEEWLRSEWTDEGGFFAFEWESRTGLALLAMVDDDPMDGWGTAVVRGLDWTRGVPKEPIVLRAMGTGVLRGRVLDSSGTPYVGLKIQAVRAIGDAQAIQLSRVESEGRGLIKVTTETNERGEFELFGLADVEFELNALIQGGRALTDEAVMSDGAWQDYVLDRPRLRVFLEDPTLEPLQVARWGGSEKWPTAPVVRVHWVDQMGPDLWRTSQVPGGRTQADGSIEFDVASDSHYRVVVFGGNNQTEVVDVEMQGRLGRVDVPIQLSANAGFGTLQFDVKDALGEPLEELVRVRVVELESGEVLIDRVPGYMDLAWIEEGPRELTLPAGSYSVFVEGQALLGVHGELARAARLGRALSTVTVEANRETVIALRIPEIVQLQIQVSGVPTESDLIWARTQAPQADPTEQLRFASRVTFWLESPGLPLERVWFESNASRRRDRSNAYLQLNDSGTVAGGLPGGRTVLHARSAGGREQTFVIELVPGESTLATLSF